MIWTIHLHGIMLQPLILKGPFFPWTHTWCSWGFPWASPTSTVVSLVSLDEHLDPHPSFSRRNSRKDVRPFTNIERPRKRGPVLEQKTRKTTSNCQIVRYPLSVFGECITGKGIAFGVVLTCLRCFQVVRTSQPSKNFLQKNSSKNDSQQKTPKPMSLKPFFGGRATMHHQTHLFFW